MKKVKELKTVTYRYDDNYLVDIVQDERRAMYSAWLYHEDYGAKMHLFGIPMINVNSFMDFVSLVETNLDLTDDINVYNNINCVE